MRIRAEDVIERFDTLVPSVKRRCRTEVAIVAHAIKALATNRWVLHSIHSDDVVEVSTLDEALREVFALDDATIVFQHGSDDSRTAWVRVILGNGNDGFDVISDWSLPRFDDGFDGALNATLAYVERLEEGIDDDAEDA